MKTMGISEFKSQALKVLSQVEKTQEVVVITKRGKPLVQITPFRDLDANSQPGRLSDSLVFEEDIVSPLGEEMWDACK